MELKGLKINFLGDSITYGIGASDEKLSYVSLIASQTGAVCRNYGISGTRIAKRREPYEKPEYDRNFCSRVEEMDADADMIVVFGGTNDYGHGDAPLGQMEDRTVWSFYGALHVLYTDLRKKYPDAKIVVLTPLKRLEETRDGRHLTDYVQAIRDVAGEYGLPILDLYRDFPCDLHDRQMQQRCLPDGLHPSDAGHRLLADTIVEFLEKL